MTSGRHVVYFSFHICICRAFLLKSNLTLFLMCTQTLGQSCKETSEFQSKAFGVLSQALPFTGCVT